MPGRKRLPPELKRQKMCIALTAAEQTQLRSLAADDDLTISQVVGELIAKASRASRRPTTDALWAQFIDHVQQNSIYILDLGWLATMEPEDKALVYGWHTAYTAGHTDLSTQIISLLQRAKADGTQRDDLITEIYTLL